MGIDERRAPSETAPRGVPLDAAESDQVVTFRLVEEFAHELMNMLLVVRGRSALLLKRLDDQGLRQSVEQIDLAAEQAADLTKALLAAGRQQGSPGDRT